VSYGADVSWGTRPRSYKRHGVDLVFLGGVPINLSRGDQEAKDTLRTLAAELGVKVSSSVAAHAKAAKVLGCKKVVVAHPYGAHEDARLIADAERYGCEVLGVMGCGKVIKDFGRIPLTAIARQPRADACAPARLLPDELELELDDDGLLTQVRHGNAVRRREKPEVVWRNFDLAVPEVNHDRPRSMALDGQQALRQHFADRHALPRLDAHRPESSVASPDRKCTTGGFCQRSFRFFCHQCFPFC
jgi:hypothetical protein